MKVTLQVERHVVTVETDYKSSDMKSLFTTLLTEAVKKMEWVMDHSKEAKEGGAK